MKEVDIKTEITVVENRKRNSLFVIQVLFHLSTAVTHWSGTHKLQLRATQYYPALNIDLTYKKKKIALVFTNDLGTIISQFLLDGIRYEA